jgi:hypothetical protein
MSNLQKKYKKSRFSKAVKVDEKNLEWLKKNKDTRTVAGFLDKIINKYKKHYESSTSRKE